MILSGDRQLMYEDVIARLKADGLYVLSAQNRVRYYRNSFPVHISASPTSTSGTHTALEVIVDDIINGIADFMVSGGISALGFNPVNGLSASARNIGVFFNPDNLRINSQGQLDLTNNPTVSGLNITGLENGKILILSGGRLITSAINAGNHSTLSNLAADDHSQYIHTHPGSDIRNVIYGSDDLSLLTLIQNSSQIKKPFEILDSNLSPVFYVSAHGDVAVYGNLKLPGTGRNISFSDDASEHDIISLGQLRLLANRHIIETTSNEIIFKPDGQQMFTVYVNTISAIGQVTIEPDVFRISYLSGATNRLVGVNSVGKLTDSGLSANFIVQVKTETGTPTNGTAYYYAMFSSSNGIKDGGLVDQWTGSEHSGLSYISRYQSGHLNLLLENTDDQAGASSLIVLRTYGISNAKATIGFQLGPTTQPGWEVGTDHGTSGFFISYNPFGGSPNNKFFSVNTSGHAQIGKAAVIDSAFLNLPFTDTIASLSAGWIVTDAYGILVRGSNTTGNKYGFFQGIGNEYWGLGYKSTVDTSIGVSLIRWDGLNNVVMPGLSGTGERYVIVTSDGTLRAVSAVGSVSATASGTVNRLAKFATETTLGDSIVTDDGTLVSIAGDLQVNSLTGLLSGANGVLVVAPTIPIGYGGTNNTSYNGATFVWYNGTALVSSPFTSASFLTSANGTINYVPKFTTANTIGNSNIIDDGSLVTIGSNTTVGGSSLGSATFSVDGTSGTLKQIIFKSHGSNRWVIRSGAQTEISGTSQGSWFQLIARDDAGNSIDNVLEIDRQPTGAMYLSRSSIFARSVSTSGNILTRANLYLYGPNPNIVFHDSGTHIVSAAGDFSVLGQTSLVLQTSTNNIYFRPSEVHDVLTLTSFSVSALAAYEIKASNFRANYLAGSLNRLIYADAFGEVKASTIVTSAVATVSGPSSTYYAKFASGNTLTAGLLKDQSESGVQLSVNAGSSVVFFEVINEATGNNSSSYINIQTGSSTGSQSMAGLYFTTPGNSIWHMHQSALTSGFYITYGGVRFFDLNTLGQVKLNNNLTVLGSLSATGSISFNSLSGTTTRALGVDSLGNLTVVGSVSADVAGTPGRIAKFITPISVGNSILSDNGTTVTVSGNMYLYSNFSDGTLLGFQNTDTGGRIWYIGTGGSAGGAFPTGAFTIRDSTAGAIRMMITSAGSVIVGSSTDHGEKFQVAGSSYFNGTSTFTNILTMTDEGIVLNRSTGSPYINFQNGSGFSSWILQRDASDGSLELYSQGSATGTSATFRIQRSSTGTPVFDANTASGLITINNSLNVSGFASLKDLRITSFGTQYSIPFTTDTNGTLGASSTLQYNLALDRFITFNGTFAGALNISGNTHTAGWIAASNGSAIYGYGVGSPGVANHEYVYINHTGTIARLVVDKGGTGSYRDLEIFTGGTPTITVKTTHAIAEKGFLAVNWLNVSGSINIPDNAGLRSVISTPRSMISRSGTTLVVGDTDGWTETQFGIQSGNFLWKIGSSPTTYLTLNSVGMILNGNLNVSGTTNFGGNISNSNNVAANRVVTTNASGIFASYSELQWIGTASALILNGTFNVSGATNLKSTLSIFGAGIVMDNAQGINMKNSTGTTRQVLALQSDNTLDVGGTVDGGIRFLTGLGNTAGIVTSTGNWGFGSSPSSSFLHINSTSDTTNTRLRITMPTGTTTNGPYSKALLIESQDADYSTNLVHITKAAGSVNSTNGRYFRIDDGTSVLFDVGKTVGVGGSRRTDTSLYIVTSAMTAATTNYGLYIQDVNAGTNNYSIYTNAGIVRFGQYTGSSTRILGVDSNGNLTVVGAASSSVSGTGTVGRLTKFATVNSVGDSQVFEAAGTVVATSAFNISGSSTVNRDFRVNGTVGIGILPDPSFGVYVNSTILQGSDQYGVYVTPTFSSAASTSVAGVYSKVVTLNTATIIPDAYNFYVDQATAGQSPGTIQRQYGLRIADLTRGTVGNFAIYTGRGATHLGDNLNVSGDSGFSRSITVGSISREYLSASNASVGLAVWPEFLSGKYQWGAYFKPTFTPAASASGGFVTVIHAWTNTSAVASSKSYRITDSETIRVETPFLGSDSTITNHYGIRIADQDSAGITNSYALYTNGGRVRFGDRVFAISSLNVSGATRLNNRLYFGPSSFDNGGDAHAFTTVADGLMIVGKPGTSTDFALLRGGSSGGTLFDNPTATTNIRFWGDVLFASSTTNIVFTHASHHIISAASTMAIQAASNIYLQTTTDSIIFKPSNNLTLTVNTNSVVVNYLAGSGNRVVYANSTGELKDSGIAITNIVGGSGTVDYYSKFSGTNSLTNGSLKDEASGLSLYKDRNTESLEIDILNAAGGANFSSTQLKLRNAGSGSHVFSQVLYNIGGNVNWSTGTLYSTSAFYISSGSDIEQTARLKIYPNGTVVIGNLTGTVNGNRLVVDGSITTNNNRFSTRGDSSLYNQAMFTAEATGSPHFEGYDGTTLMSRFVSKNHATPVNFLSARLAIGQYNDWGDQVGLSVNQVNTNSFIVINNDDDDFWSSGLVFCTGNVNRFLFATMPSTSNLEIYSYGAGGSEDSASPRIRFNYSDRNMFLAGSGGKIRVGDMTAPSYTLDVVGQLRVSQDTYLGANTNFYGHDHMIYGDSNSRALYLTPTTLFSSTNGALIGLYGKDHGSAPGNLDLYCATSPSTAKIGLNGPVLATKSFGAGVTTVTSTSTVTLDENHFTYIVRCNGTKTVNLPSSTNCLNRIYTVLVGNSTTQIDLTVGGGDAIKWGSNPADIGILSLPLTTGGVTFDGLTLQASESGIWSVIGTICQT